MIPYGRQHISSADIAAVVKALKSDWITQGPKVAEFEEALCRYTGAKYAVVVSSATAALHLSCLAIGIKKGDEVITSPITFVASANSVLYAGGKPVFADVDKDTINIDPEDIERKITGATKAIMPVHYAGRSCEMKRIHGIARRHGLAVIEDAAHALGASYHKRPVGCCQYSDITVFSFHPVKSMTTAEGGAALTNDKGLYRKMLLLRSHGIVKDEESLEHKDQGPWYHEMQQLGFHYRLTDIQCALGISQLRGLDGFIKRRRAIASRYDRALSGISALKVPATDTPDDSARHLYYIRLDHQDERRKAVLSLRQMGIGTQVHYIPVYWQPYYRRLGYRQGLCPVAEDYYRRTISIPLYPTMSAREVALVIKGIKTVFNKG